MVMFLQKRLAKTVEPLTILLASPKDDLDLNDPAEWQRTLPGH